LSQRHTDDGLYINVRLDDAALGRALRAGASVVASTPAAGVRG
jgi:hypothetical protein